MIEVGKFNSLRIKERTDLGVYLDDGSHGILLPAKYVPKNNRLGDIIDVFVYHDSEDRIIATTQQPKAMVGDVAKLKVVDATPSGAYLDWGLPKDLFVHKSQQHRGLQVGDDALVLIYLDDETGRVAATEKIEDELSNETITVNEMDEVDLVVLRPTDIGYIVMVNNKHTGLLHYNEVFIDLFVGEKLVGFVKTIKEDNKLDIVLGRAGFAKVEDEAGKILDLLKQHKGFLPFHDKSLPDDIYAFFGMSKKTFKMTIGNLYKQKLISIASDGITLLK